MTDVGGAVFKTAAEDRAVFLTSEDLGFVREMLDLIEARPTAAGSTLDTESLARLSRAVDLGDEESVFASAIVLSAGEQSCLELVRDQILVRGQLPPRIRRTCTTCGNERIINPERRPTVSDRAPSEATGQSLITSAQLFVEGHPFLGTLSLLSALDGAKTPEAGQDPVCTRCEGDEFETVAVTFCPNCRAVRDESVLIRCPECDFDFRGRLSDEAPLWGPVPEAMAQVNALRNVAVLERRAGEFENGLWPGQRKALAEALAEAPTPDEQLLGMCRCGRRDEFGRYVALLLTTARLVWAWETAVSGADSGELRWRDVRAITEHGDKSNQYLRGISFTRATGDPVVFIDFRGRGVSFRNPPLRFTVDDLLPLARDLQRRPRP
jgi:hypothetical protein